MAIIYLPLTISTSAYSTGDVIGGEIAIPATNPGLLTAITVYDADGEGVQLDFFFFGDDLVGTYTDNAAFAVDASDMPKLIGVCSIATTDYLAAGSDKAGTVTPVNVPVKSGGTWLVIVIRSTTTYTATTDLRLTLSVLE